MVVENSVIRSYRNSRVAPRPASTPHLPPSSSLLNSEQIIVVMRHGERRDGAVDATPEVDPPLTEHGITQVSKAAEKLRSILGEKKTKKMQLIVSPFLRTLQTAQELQRCGVGDLTPRIVDNTLCEVYGPSRIKSRDPPSFPDWVMKGGSGSLPQWGESIELASQRYVENLHRNSRLYPNRHLLLVTHGDAISAILTSFYPMRIVYETEYLSFIALSKVAPSHCNGKEDMYELLGSSGVHWLLDGPEIASPEVYLQETESGSGSSGSGFNAPESINEITINSTYGVECLNNYNTSNNYNNNCTDLGNIEFNNDSTTNLQGIGEDEFRVRRICNTGNMTRLSICLRLAIIFSQLLIFSLWMNRNDAIIYIAVLGVLELGLISVQLFASNCSSLAIALIKVENFPVSTLEFNNNNNVNNIDSLGFLLQFCATALKAFFIFFISVVLALWVSLIQQTSFNMINSYRASLTTPINFLVFLLFWIFDMTRGFCEPGYREELREIL